MPRLFRDLALASLAIFAFASGAVAQTSAEAPDATALAEAHEAQAGSDPFEPYLERGEVDPGVPSPENALGHEIGGWFTRHADMLGYLGSIAGASDRVNIETYGQTHQRRDLVLCTISSPENLARLDEILKRNTRLADPRSRTQRDVHDAVENNPAIVWFSFNVHGNEPSCTESAIQLIYTLAASEDARVREILNNVVVVIDPCLNPDGRERYVSWYDNAVGARPDSNPDAAEHFEPWPQGRTNHYYFDLNRDWLWGVHPESRARLEVYKRYLPHLHIDFHEQGYKNPYFFGLGEKPYNKNIPQETVDWIGEFGAANASAFDARGLVYSTEERFDYLYPGYGKVLPTYHGAVGMLCEKGGHSRAGLAIDFSEDHVLTLRERAAHHFIVAMSDLEHAAQRRRENTERFARFFTLPADPEAFSPVTYAIAKDNDPAMIRKLIALCVMHDIEIHEPSGSARVPAGEFLGYRTGQPDDPPARLEDCWLIPGDQPRGALVRAVFERSTFIEDPETYDITGWSLPIAWGLDAWVIERDVSSELVPYASVRPAPAQTEAGKVGTVIGADQHNFPRAVGALVRNNCFARIAGGAFTIEGRTFPAGSLILHTIRNEGRMDAFLDECRALGVEAFPINAGVSDDGYPPGADDNARFVPPRILLVRNEPTSAYSYGQLWHLLDIEMRLPHTAVNTHDLRRVDLSEYNVIVLPHLYGAFTDAIGEGMKSDIESWLRAGGTIVAIGGGADWAARAYLGEPDDAPETEADEDEDPEDRDLSWEERRQRRQSRSIPGAMLSAEVDTGHPLSAGVRDWVGVIKRGDRVAPLRERGSALARFDSEDPVIGGVVSDEQAETLAGEAFVSHHRVGAGSVVCVSDDVTIRGFVHAPVRLILNAISLGPSVN